MINNNSTPEGGPEDCKWSTNNCGPNDEIFGFIREGQLPYLPTGVHFISDDIEPIAMRALITRSEEDSATGPPYTGRGDCAAKVSKPSGEIARGFLCELAAMIGMRHQREQSMPDENSVL